MEEELAHEFVENSLSKEDEILEYLEKISAKLKDIDKESEAMSKTLELDDEQLHACFSL